MFTATVWWWKVCLAVVCVETDFSQIWSHIHNKKASRAVSPSNSSLSPSHSVSLNNELCPKLATFYKLHNHDYTIKVLYSNTTTTQCSKTILICISLKSIAMADIIQGAGFNQVNTVIMMSNELYSLLIRASYFISWSAHAQFTFVTFIVCKWCWRCRYFLNQCMAATGQHSLGFLKLFLCGCLYVCVCVCVRPRGYYN